MKFKNIRIVILLFTYRFVLISAIRG